MKLSIRHTRLRNQCRSLNSDIFRIHITNDSQWHCGSSFIDSNHYVKSYDLCISPKNVSFWCKDTVKECPLHQNETILGEMQRS